MKPINDQERKIAFAKFLLSGVVLLSIFGYGIYSYSFVHKDIKTNISNENTEIESLKNFIDTADKLVESIDASESLVDQNKYSVELNQYIVGQKKNYVKSATLFSRIEDNYRTLLRSKEEVQKIGLESKSNCEEELAAYKEQIDDLEKKVEKMEDNQQDAGKDIKSVRSSLERIASDLANLGEDFYNKDWCKMIGGAGKANLKTELKDKLTTKKNEILSQASVL